MPSALMARPGKRLPGVHGDIARWAAGTGPVIAATDASWKKGHGGLGYLTSTGQRGFRAEVAKSFLLTWHQTALAA